MKKPSSPHRTPTTPYASIPYTVGFYDFVKNDKMATIAKTTFASKNSMDLRRSPFSRELEIDKTSYSKSAVKSPHHSNSKNMLDVHKLDEDSVGQLVRQMVKAQLNLQRKRLLTGGIMSDQFKSNQGKQLAEVKLELKALSKRLETQKQDRVKVIQGLWHCFNQKIEDEMRINRQELFHVRENSDASVKLLVDKQMVTFSKNIAELKQELQHTKELSDSLTHKLRHEMNVKFNQRNSQTEVIINSIEHLNVLIGELSSEHIKQKSKLQGRIEEISKQLLTLSLPQTKQSKHSLNKVIQQEIKREFETFRQSIKADIYGLKKAQTEQLQEMVEKSIQSCETDCMNMKSRMKKIQTVIKQMTINGDAAAKLEDNISERLQSITLAYNQNFDHLQSTQRELAINVNSSVELIKALSKKLAEMMETSDSTRKSSIMEIVSLKNQLAQMTEARLQSELQAIRQSLSSFQIESRKHIQRQKSSDQIPQKSLKFAKSDCDIYNNCSSNSSIEMDKKLDDRRHTGETIDTSESNHNAEKKQ